MDETTIRLAYGLTGLLLGLIAGWASRAARDTRAIRKALMTDPATPHRRSNAPIAGLAVITLLAVISSWWTNDQVRDLARCARDYAEANSNATRPVREAAIKLDAADDRVWHAAEDIFTQSADRDDYMRLRAAIDDRNRLSDELEQARIDNPPPDPPETFCNEG
jgi:hypothetical protein